MWHSMGLDFSWFFLVFPNGEILTHASGRQINKNGLFRQFESCINRLRVKYYLRPDKIR